MNHNFSETTYLIHYYTAIVVEQISQHREAGGGELNGRVNRKELFAYSSRSQKTPN